VINSERGAMHAPDFRPLIRTRETFIMEVLKLCPDPDSLPVNTNKKEKENRKSIKKVINATAHLGTKIEHWKKVGVKIFFCKIRDENFFFCRGRKIRRIFRLRIQVHGVA
jgi:hypothetical protein